MHKLIAPAIATLLMTASVSSTEASPDHHKQAQEHHAAEHAHHVIQKEHRATRHAHHVIQREHRATRQAHHIIHREHRMVGRALDRWRGNIHAHHRYHWRNYHRPRGWYRHRWVHGEFLPRAWWARNYWIGDWAAFGLIAPPYGYVWVRVGDDALLIDTDTGVILRVVYGVFY